MLRTWNPRSAAIVIFAAWLFYAILRYHVARGDDWMKLPLWTTNKALATAGLALICVSYWIARLRSPGIWACWTGMLGYGLAAMHTLASLMLMSPGYYRKFYDAASLGLNWTGSISMLAGVVALACFTCAAITSVAGVREWLSQDEFRRWQQVGVWGLYLTLIHVFVMGIVSFLPQDIAHWLQPKHWPRLGFLPLPSITLLSTLMILATIWMRWRYRRK